MGILGYTVDFQNQNVDNFIDKFYYVDLCTHCLYHGVDWIYAFVETTSVYDFKGWYFWFLSLMFQDAYDAYFMSYWVAQLFSHHFQFYSSILLDNFLFVLINKLPYNDDWFRMYLASIDLTSTLYYYPELLVWFNVNTIDQFFPYASYLRMSVEYLLNSENLLTAVMLFPQYMFCLVMIGVALMIYFNYFTTMVKEENIIDHDYLIFSATLDAEEEIGSLDDIILGFLIFFYMFAWFFYAHFWATISLVPEFLLILWMMPIIYVIILAIPLSLLYDFGIYFVSYLRGSSSTPTFLSETMFDYIALFGLCIRLIVQAVRLLLMFFVYASFHDLILYWCWDVRWFYSHDAFWQSFYNLDLTVDSISYFLFLKVPTYFIYLFYELLHTFFVVTAQFFAFIGMVFWLFFFLYTFFTYEPQEAYLSYKRNTQKLKKFFYGDIK